MRTGAPGMVLIEGIMGAGKTTTAQFVDSQLQEMGLSTKLFLEGNLNHPADYDGVAVLTANELNQIYRDHPEHEETLRTLVQVAPLTGEAIASRENNPTTYLIPSRKAQREFGDEQMPSNLVEALAKYDVYDGIGLAKHREVLQASWEQFATRAAADTTAAAPGESTDPTTDPSTYIFDCAFLQNPLCKFIAMHDAGTDALKAHITQLAETVLALRPALVYLYPTNVRETLQRVIPERPKEWLDAVIDYHTKQAYGQAHGLAGQGLDGLIEFLRVRQQIEIDICKQLPFPVKIVVDPHEDWERAKNEIAEFIDEISNQSHD